MKTSANRAFGSPQDCGTLVLAPSLSIFKGLLQVQLFRLAFEQYKFDPHRHDAFLDTYSDVLLSANFKKPFQRCYGLW